ncbi:VanZ family protein [Bacillus sp. LL01]|uniref:VanZ family protein n=1 Tax=Bacillus sp. LL01 TaxID=1665556 RepID=UPI00064CF79A|nr:VanZ family protein [Bacillus sp. LL01]KMJ59063.1 VanZ family protein [Bacillus sp. LL01]
MQKRSFYEMILSWGSVLGWMALIFYLSAQHAEQSANLSGGITDAVKVFVDQVAPESNINIESLSYFVRKNAHFFAYLLLGLFSLNALRRSGVTLGKSAALAFTISVLYAISDEVHQLFVPGRIGQVSDVLLDSAGALVGIGLYLLVRRWRSRR